MTEAIKVWCYNDAHNWGSMLAQTAAARGHDAHVFEDPREPDHGYMFMHMHYHPQVRELHKRCMQIMAMNPSLKMIPDYRSSVLYDDKAEQVRQFARWMPRTHIFWTPNAARRHLDKFATIPFVSKSKEGANGHNVRMVSTLDEARLEIKQAFSDLGIKARYGQTQRGYLLWQDFVPDNAGDIRVATVGAKRLIVRRGNRGDRPIAPGQRLLTPVTGLDADLIAPLATANTFFEAEELKWAAVDMVCDKVTGRWFVLESTISWTMNAFYECAFIGRDGVASDRMGDQVWNVLMDEIEQGSFD